MTRKSVKNMRAVGDLDKFVGQRIRQLRLQIDLSQNEIAETLGISFQQVQKYEKGVNRLSVGRLLELADILKTTPHDLLGYNAPVNKGVSLNPFNVEIYKLAQDFVGLDETSRVPIRALINSLIALNTPKRKKVA